MNSSKLLVVPLCCLALVGCNGGLSLEEFASKSLVFLVTDPDAPAFQAVLDYDVTAKGCGPLGGASATQDGKDLKNTSRGGLAKGDSGPCPRPYWTMNAGDPSAPYTTVKLEDGSGAIQAVMENLFAKRTVSLKSAPSGKFGDAVVFEFQPPTDKMDDLEVSFLADGAAAGDKVIWYAANSGQVQWEKNTVTVPIPARQLPATGQVTLAGSPKAAVFACDGLDSAASCRTDGLKAGGSFAFTVTP